MDNRKACGQSAQLHVEEKAFVSVLEGGIVFLVVAHHFRHFKMLLIVIVIALRPCPLLHSSARQQHHLFMFVLHFMFTIGHVCQIQLSFAASLNNPT